MRKKKHPEHVNHERWLVSYADFITLLFAFFVVMFAVSQVDSSKVGRFTQSFQQAIGIELATGGAGILPGEGPEAFEGSKKNATEGYGGNGDKLGAELAALGKALEQQAKIKRELSGLKIVRRGNELVLRLDASILFRSGLDELTDDARKVLLAIAQEIKDRPVKVRVEGHTDDRPIASGRFRSNWDLSTSRATNVVVDLASAGGIKPHRLAAVGYAEFQPLGDNTTSEGRLQNRRVDFVLTVDLPTPSLDAPAPPPQPSGVQPAPAPQHAPPLQSPAPATSTATP